MMEIFVVIVMILLLLKVVIPLVPSKRRKRAKQLRELKKLRAWYHTMYRTENEYKIRTGLPEYPGVTNVDFTQASGRTWVTIGFYDCQFTEMEYYPMDAYRKIIRRIYKEEAKRLLSLSPSKNTAHEQSGK